jgi:hypothetical protein
LAPASDQLLHGGFGVGLGNAFLDGLRSAVDQVLGFLQAQAGEFAHGLDDGHLVGAGFEQDHVELGLLFGGGSGTSQPPAAGAAIAAADTPNFSSMALTRSLSSITDMLSSAVRKASLSNAILVS